MACRLSFGFVTGEADVLTEFAEIRWKRPVP
jgi:hypothetical protein